MGDTAGSWLDCGSGADGVPRPGQEPGGLPGWQAELLRRQIAQEVIAHRAQAPDAPPWARSVRVEPG